MADAKEQLAKSGYGGTPMVITAPGDALTLDAEPMVAAQLLRGDVRQRSTAMTERRPVTTKHRPQILSREDERIEARTRSGERRRGLKWLFDRLLAIV